MRGRPRKPVGTTHRKGNDTPIIELVEREQGVPAIVPKPPDGLLKASRDRWAAYWRSPVSGAVDLDSDGGLLERWIRAVDEYERVGKVFRGARLVQGSRGQAALNPLAAYLAQLERTIAQAEEHLGLTPYARQRLGVVIGRAALTAEALNRTLDERTDQPAEPDAIDAEWAEG